MSHEYHDEHKGRILTRREVFSLLGGAGAALFVARSGGLMAFADEKPALAPTPATNPKTPARSCIARPELTEGPYFVDEKLLRSDIRSDAKTGLVKPGMPLELVFNVSKIEDSACVALAGATVDVWHCDAQGLYSDVGSDGTGNQTFLRGAQLTDQAGVARFKTIYPGWYRGRAVHIHYKIRAPKPGGGIYEFTSQLFFDDAFSDRIYARTPYLRTGQRDQFNTRDGIFQEGGEGLILDLKPVGNGFKTAFDIGLDFSKPSSGRSGPGGRPGGRPPRRGGFGWWGDN